MFHTRDHTSKIIISFSACCCVRRQCVRCFYARVPSLPFFHRIFSLSPLLSFLSFCFFLSFFLSTTDVFLVQRRLCRSTNREIRRDPREKRARRRCWCVCVYRCGYVRIRVGARPPTSLDEYVCVCVRAR